MSGGLGPATGVLIAVVLVYLLIYVGENKLRR